MTTANEDGDGEFAIDFGRIQRRLDHIWELGRTKEGGVTRLAYSDEETEAIEYICDELDDSFEIRTDQVGNLFASKQPDADRTLMLGSHLDSVHNGGRLDGTLGVVLALEAIQTAYEYGQPVVPPTLAIFRAEESSRFGQWAVGSRGALGQLTVEDLSATDQSGIPIWQAMQSQGLQPENFSEPTIDLDRLTGFLEAHIEQGRVLDDADQDVGIVSSIRGPVRHQITVEGNYDHSGATPMDLRQDAIAGGAEMVTAIERIARDATDEGDIVATVGEFTPIDSAINKVCGEVTFSIDIRSNDTEFRGTYETEILEQIQTVADERDLTITTSEIDRSKPINLDQNMKRRLREAAQTLNIEPRQLPSGGGHDAMNLQHAGVPTGMLFVPSIDGISHSPNEETSDSAIRKAARILTYVLLQGVPPASR